MAARRTGKQRFVTRIATEKKGQRSVVVPFDPNRVWGEKATHHVRGTIDGTPWRGPLQRAGKKYILALGPAWVRDAGIDLRGEVTVALDAEGPQRDDLAPDVEAALAAAPEASRFFDALATFYRTTYLRWIDATKRHVRAERIAELVTLLEAGHKQRPRR